MSLSSAWWWSWWPRRCEDLNHVEQSILGLRSWPARRPTRWPGCSFESSTKSGADGPLNALLPATASVSRSSGHNPLPGEPFRSARGSPCETSDGSFLACWLARPISADMSGRAANSDPMRTAGYRSPVVADEPVGIIRQRSHPRQPAPVERPSQRPRALRHHLRRPRLLRRAAHAAGRLRLPGPVQRSRRPTTRRPAGVSSWATSSTGARPRPRCCASSWGRSMMATPCASPEITSPAPTRPTAAQRHGQPRTGRDAGPARRESRRSSPPGWKRSSMAWSAT